MMKKELMALIVECMEEYTFNSVKPRNIKENTMRKNELKALVQEVVRQTVKEAANPFDQDNDNQSGAETEVPNFDGASEDPTDMPSSEIDVNHGEEDENKEIRLLKAMAKILIELLEMHKTMEPVDNSAGEDAGGLSGDGSSDAPESQEPFDSQESSTSSEVPSENGDEEDDNDEKKEVDENFRKTGRGAKTINDYPNNPDPEGARDPEVPQV